MKFFKNTLLLIIILTFSINLLSEVVEEIYAIVNNEVITRSEFLEVANVKIQEINKTAEKKVYTLSKKDKLEALDMMIESKLLLSRAKLKDFDVKNDVKMWVEEIKKQNNFSSDKDLEAALKSQGINMTLEQFLNSKKLQVMQQRLVQEEVSRNISIDNSEIMDHFKKNKNKYMTAMTIELNCIFLTKESTSTDILQSKMNKISEELKKGGFKAIAIKHSQLTTDPKTNFYLGKFKEGELNKKLEENAIKLQKNGFSDWIETENGWYIIQLLDRVKSKFVEYKSVRGEIRNEIFMKKNQIELKKYIKELKKNSYIEIFVNF